MSIPKKIHYCWFGGAPLGENEKRCIESWRTYLPDYEIIRWDESNTDLNCCDYVHEAYCQEKWAFVSDFVRFQVLYAEGGIYFDTDVELIKSIDDILEQGSFMACERDGDGVCRDEGAPYNEGIKVAPGLGFAVEPGDMICEKMLESYSHAHFELADGELDQKTVVERLTDILLDEGLKQNDGLQEVVGLTIYPADFFNPKDYGTGKINITENTRAIHHFAGSWLSPSLQFEWKLNDYMEKHGLNTMISRKVTKIIAILVFRDLGRIKNKAMGSATK